jgi:hypothetical protein
MRRVLIPMAVAAVVLAAAGCTSTGTISHTARPLTTGGLTGTPTGPTATGPTPSSDNVASKDFGTPTPSAPPSLSADFGPTPPGSTALVARFSPYPAGARPWVKNKTGPLALDEFVELFYVQDAWPDEKALAKQRGMQGVARHGWFNKDETQTEVYLVKFSAAGGAQKMYQDLLGSWADKSRTGSVTEFDAPTVHGKGEIDPVADSQGDTTVKVAFVVGDVFAYVRDYSPTAPDKAGTVALALKQYTTLKTGH